ncbi:energy transducer TonB [Providencia rettgeri]|uniref:energy transducer TonB family protein n=1 Tax=Providencia rettgeri TaxID=587 RepID=UPI0034E05C6E
MLAITLEHNRATKTSSSFALAIVLHIAVILFYLKVTENDWQHFLPPPSVVMEVSIDSQAKQLTETNIGETQELAVASEAKEAVTDDIVIPSVPINEEAEERLTKVEKKKISPAPKKKHKDVKNQRISEMESDNSKASAAPVTSDAAAKQQTERVAATFDSHAQSDDEQRQWEALVLGQLNKFKRYPEDAKRRNRIGKPVIKFEVDAQGYIVNSVLVKSSGTNSLDREAQRVLTRAEPLPIPPSEMLNQGKVIVELPIDFTIENK